MSLLLALFAGFALPLPQQPEPVLPKVGARAPALQYDHLLGAAGRAPALATAGKVVVLSHPGTLDAATLRQVEDGVRPAPKHRVTPRA